MRAPDTYIIACAIHFNSFSLLKGIGIVVGKPLGYLHSRRAYRIVSGRANDYSSSSIVRLPSSGTTHGRLSCLADRQAPFDPLTYRVESNMAVL